MPFLEIEDKTFLITGVTNKKSIAYSAAKTLIENGAQCVFSVFDESLLDFTQKNFPNSKVFTCDVQNENQIQKLALDLKQNNIQLNGFLHSIAFANFSEPKPFHEVNYKDFDQAVRISCFSLIELSNALKDILTPNASVVAISISTTKATPYGYMGPIKAMLNSTVDYLAHSFSEFSQIRFNAIGAGPLKTSASSGIPGYIDNYLFSEQLTLRKKALKTQEVANSIAFLLSPKSSGMNASFLKLDAGMEVNYFDQDIVKKSLSF
jgi:enoyl-[acyl-carrier protein] reductase I